MSTTNCLTIDRRTLGLPCVSPYPINAVPRGDAGMLGTLGIVVIIVIVDLLFLER